MKANGQCATIRKEGQKLPDLSFQDLSTVGSDKSSKPATIASAATVAPTTFLSFITGTVAIVTITPPVSGAHMLCFVYTTTTPVANTTAGNIQNISTPATNIPAFYVFDPITAKYFAGKLAVAAAS